MEKSVLEIGLMMKNISQKNSKESKLVLTNLLHCILDPVKESSFDLLDFVSAYFSELLEQVLLF